MALIKHVYQLKFKCINDGETYIKRVRPQFLESDTLAAAREYAAEYIKHNTKDLKIKDVTRAAAGTLAIKAINGGHYETFCTSFIEQL